MWNARHKAGRDECKGETHEAIRPHREAARHQAREGLELETHLRKHRRLFRSADRRRNSWSDEIDETAGSERRRVVRVIQIRNRDAQRDADAWHSDAADRPPDLPLLRTGDGQRPGLEGADRGGIWRRHHVGDRFRHGDGAAAQSEGRPRQDHDVGQIPAVQILRRQRQRAGIWLQGGVRVRSEWRMASSEWRVVSDKENLTIRRSQFAPYVPAITWTMACGIRSSFSPGYALSNSEWRVVVAKRI